jgi:Asp-tRNA(Asn)/Glu-tRNA(Gln) amidotransferase C subunit
MSIDRKTVDHVAMLARLALTDDEREHTQEQLSAILEHINVIAEADRQMRCCRMLQRARASIFACVRFSKSSMTSSMTRPQRYIFWLC